MDNPDDQETLQSRGDVPANLITSQDANALSDHLSQMRRDPHHHLAEAALGRRPVEPGDVEGLLASHLMVSDALASTVADHEIGLLAMLFSDAGGKPDAEAVLKLIERMSKLHAVELSELRKTADLLSRMLKPQRPEVSVYAAGQVNVADQQVNSLSSVSLGDPER